jgi:photosystem II stability/assembly factor-like uncharacterized protein
MMLTVRHCVLAAAVVMLLAGASYARGSPPAESASYITAIKVDPMRPNVVYASALGGSRGAVIKSTDGGRTWSAADAGLTVPPGYDTPHQLRVDALAIDPRSPNVLYAGTALGVFKSSDGAETWKRASNGIKPIGDPLEHRLAEGFVYAIAIDPLRTSTVYAAGGSRSPTGGMWKSTNRGANWKRVLGDWAVDVGIDPRRPETVYAGVMGPPMPIRGAILKTVDGGGSWRATGPPGLRDSYFGHPIVVDRRAPGTIYAGGSRGLFASANDGRTWSRVLPLRRAFSGVNAIALDPTRARVLYAGTVRAIVKSEDGGQTWSAPRLAGRYVSAIAIARTRPQTIYAGAQWKTAPDKSTAGVFASTDGGSTWRRVL